MLISVENERTKQLLLLAGSMKSVDYDAFLPYNSKYTCAYRYTDANVHKLSLYVVVHNVPKIFSVSSVLFKIQICLFRLTWLGTPGVDG